MAGFRVRGTIADMQVIPYPAVSLFLDLGDQTLNVDDGAGTRLSGSIAVALAPRTLHGYGQRVDCLQIRLSPLLARAVGLPPDLGQAATLADAWGGSAVRLENALRAASSWQGRFASATGAILERASTRVGVDAEVGWVWRRLTASRGSARVQRLATEVGWSRKRLWARFTAQLGITPKRAARLIRFDRAAHLLASGRSPAVVAAESGYADQSHLSREVADFAGSTPRLLAIAPWLDVDDVAWSRPGYAMAEVVSDTP